jgi:hypothetical protein
MFFLDPLNISKDSVFDIQIDNRLTREAVNIYLDIVSRVKDGRCNIKKSAMMGYELKQYINSVPELVRFGYMIKLPRPKDAPRNESNRYVLFHKPVLSHKMKGDDFKMIDSREYCLEEFKSLYPDVDADLVAWKDWTV